MGWDSSHAAAPPANAPRGRAAFSHPQASRNALVAWRRCKLLTGKWLRLHNMIPPTGDLAEGIARVHDQPSVIGDHLPIVG